MYNDIKDVFNKHIKIDIDKKLLNNITKFRLSWVSKEDIYMEFLSSNLIGIHPIRFSIKDDTIFYNTILKVEEDLIKYDVYNTKGINKAWKVSSNPFYHTIVYLMYKFAISKLSRRDIEEAIRELFYIFCYKAASSLYAHYFAYNVELPIAKALNEKLTNKFLLKKLGSWKAVFEYRAEDVLPKGLHWDRLVNLDTDSSIRIIIDIQTRLRDIIKNIYPILLDIKDNNNKIISNTIVRDNDGEKTVLELTNTSINYINNLKANIKNPLHMYNEDLARLIVSFFNNTKEEYFREIFTYISNTNIKELDTILEYIVSSSISYLRNKGIVGDYNKFIINIITMLKGYYSQSSVKNKDIIYVKKHMLTIVKKSIKKSTVWLLSSVNIAIIVYISIKALCKDI